MTASSIQVVLIMEPHSFARSGWTRTTPFCHTLRVNDGEEEQDPSSVTTEEQFVVALRRLRERSGLTYKEIERRTSAGDGLPLPASTLATALHRHTVPRREIVTALVQVCGDRKSVV